MESERRPAAAAAAVSKVLDDDDLLAEIIVRLASPSSLVHAALVCKRWLRTAAHGAFLRRFRGLHPPRLLGFYVNVRPVYLSFLPIRPPFVPMPPHPPEPEFVAAARRAASYTLDAYDAKSTSIQGCRNGSVLVGGIWNGRLAYGVHTPLCPERGMAVVPPRPRLRPNGADLSTFACLLSAQDGHGSSSSSSSSSSYYYYLWLSMEVNRSEHKSTAEVYTLQDGSWHMRASAATQLAFPIEKLDPLLAGDKIYMTRAGEGNILVLDLAASSFFTIRLPQGVELEPLYRNTMLSPANDSAGVYLIHVKELQLCIWLHKEDNWSLVDSVCLREACAVPGMLDAAAEDEHSDVVAISNAGDNAEFVFLKMGRCALYLDVKCRALRKVYELTGQDHDLGDIHPFMMIWPPTFPTLKE